MMGYVFFGYYMWSVLIWNGNEIVGLEYWFVGD